MSAFRGTIAQMVEAGVSCNGITLNQPELSLLTRLGNGLFAVAVGKIPPEGQGKPAIVWEVTGTDNLKFKVPRANRTATATATVPTESTVTNIKRGRGRPRKDASQDAVKPTEVTAMSAKRARRTKAQMEAAAAQENANKSTATVARRTRTVDLTGGAAVSM